MREKHQSATSHTCPQQGSNLQSLGVRTALLPIGATHQGTVLFFLTYTLGLKIYVHVILKCERKTSTVRPTSSYSNWDISYNMYFPKIYFNTQFLQMHSVINCIGKAMELYFQLHYFFSRQSFGYY